MPDPTRDLLLSGLKRQPEQDTQPEADEPPPLPERTFSGSGPGFDLMDLLDNPAVSTVTTALDTLARPVRTALGTGDLARSFESIYNPDVALSEEGLKKAWGLPEFNQGAGFDAGDILDFASTLGVGVLTDPTTYVSAGLTSAGKQLAGKGAKAARLAVTGKRAEALAEVAGSAERLAHGGLMPKLSQRLREGESAVHFAGIPVIGKSAAPAVEYAEKALGTAGTALEAVAPGVVNWARKARDFFSEGSGYAGLDAMGQFTAGQVDTLQRGLVKDVARATDEARAAGLSEEAIGLVEGMVNSRASKEHIASVAKITGLPEDQILGKFQQRFSPDKLADEINKLNLTDTQRDKLMILADRLEAGYKLVRDEELKAGLEVATLGQHATVELATAKDALSDAIRTLAPDANLDGVSDLAAYAKSSIVRDADMSEASRKALNNAVEAYEKSIDFAATVPGYTPLRVGKDAYPVLLNAAKQDPEIIRKLTNITGQVATRDEANELVRALGTAATAGRAVHGRIDFADLAKIYRSNLASGDLTKTQKQIAEAMEKAGKFFKDNPLEVFGDRVSSAARAVGKQKYMEGVRAALGRGLPPEITKLYDKIEAAQKAYRKVSPADRVAKLEASDALSTLERQLQDKLGRGAEGMPLPGMVRKGEALASEVFPDLKGTKNDFLMPAEALEMVKNHRESMKKPEVWGGVFRPLAQYTTLWKTISVSSPATMTRNKLGGLIQRAMFGGVDAQSAADEFRVLSLQRALASGDEAAAAKIVFDIGDGRTANGLELTNSLRELGTLNSGFWSSDTGEPIKRQLTKKGVVGKLLDLPRSVASGIENGDKFGHVLARMRAGDTMEQAALSANKVLFNYSSTSPAVQLMRKTGLMPFAAWSAKNIPLQFELLIKSPGKLMALLHAKNAIEDGVPGYDERELPSYVKDKFNVTFKRNKDGSVDFVTLDGLLPMADLPKVLDARKFVADMIGPIPKTMAETVFNRDLFTNKDIESFDAHVKPMLGFDVPVRGYIANAAETLLPQSHVIKQFGQVATGEEYKTTLGAPSAVAGLVLPTQVKTNAMRKQDEVNADVMRLKSVIGRLKGEIRREAELRPWTAQRLTGQLVALEQQLREKEAVSKRQRVPSR